MCDSLCVRHIVKASCYFQVLLKPGAEIGTSTLHDIRGAAYLMIGKCAMGPRHQGGIANKIRKSFPLPTPFSTPRLPFPAPPPSPPTFRANFNARKAGDNNLLLTIGRYIPGPTAQCTSRRTIVNSCREVMYRIPAYTVQMRFGPPRTEPPRPHVELPWVLSSSESCSFALCLYFLGGAERWGGGEGREWRERLAESFDRGRDLHDETPNDEPARGERSDVLVPVVGGGDGGVV